MIPVSPVAPGIDLPEIIIAKDQLEYMPLPAYIHEDGAVYTRWKLDEREKKRIAETGDLWLTILTFGRNLQPVHLSTECPLAVMENPDGE